MAARRGPGLAAARVMASGAPVQALAGAAGWQRRGHACHASAARVMRKVPAGRADGRADGPRRILSDRHAPDPAVRAAGVAGLPRG